MLIQQGTGRSEAIDLRLACTLAAVAGSLNAAAFYAVGFFSANMTGNLSALSIDAATGNWQKGVFYLTILLAFVTGAGISAAMINAGQRRGAGRIYAVTILVEAMLLILLGGCDLWLHAEWRVATVVLGLSFIMGLQNAVVTRISDARVRTTHVSGMATDIGIELAMLADHLLHRTPSSDSVILRSRLRLHLATIVSFLAGGIIGVAIYRAMAGYLMWITALVLMCMAGAAWFRPRPPSPDDVAEQGGVVIDGVGDGDDIAAAEIDDGIAAVG